MATTNDTVTTTATTNTGLREGFFGVKKQDSNIPTSSVEHHDTLPAHAQADAQAQHQAALMSAPPSATTPLPRQVLNEVLAQHGTPAHAHHVDVQAVEKKHDNAVGPLGHVQDKTVLDKATHAFKNVTSQIASIFPTPASTSTVSIPLTPPVVIQRKTTIPRSNLPDETLLQIKKSHRHVLRRHVNINVVEKRHQNYLNLGHVIEKPTILEKIGDTYDSMVLKLTGKSTSTSTSSDLNKTNKQPHCSLPPRVLQQVKTNHPNLHHVVPQEHCAYELGHIKTDKQTNILHNSLPKYVMDDIIKPNHKLNHIDIQHIEMERDQRLCREKSIGKVVQSNRTVLKKIQ